MTFPKILATISGLLITPLAIAAILNGDAATPYDAFMLALMGPMLCVLFLFFEDLNAWIERRFPD